MERLEKKSQRDKQKKDSKIIKKGLILLLVSPFILVGVIVPFGMLFEKTGIQLSDKYLLLFLFVIELLPFVGIGMIIYGIVGKIRNKTEKPPEKDIIYTLIDPEEIEEMRRKRSFINTFEHRMDVLEEFNNNKRNIENKDITLKVIHHRLRSAWCSPSCPNGVPDDAIEVFNNQLKYNVVDVIDEGRQIILVIDFAEDKIKCVMKSCLNSEVYDVEFSCNYNESYVYHEPICDAMESWEFLFECKSKETLPNEIVNSSTLKSWSIEKEILGNSYGKVFTIRNRNTDELNCLEIMTIFQSCIDSNFIDDIGEDEAKNFYKIIAENIRNEISRIQNLKSENIIEIKDCEMIINSNRIGYYFLIRTEKINTVRCNYLSKQNAKEKIKFAIDVCKALEECEKSNVIHGNLNFTSVYLSKKDQYKIGNFRCESVEQLHNMMARRGTYNYMAPEMYMGEKYDHRADIYSLGIMLYRLFNEGLLPFVRNKNSFAEQQDSLMKRMKGVGFPKPLQANDKVAQIILKACSYSPSQRYRTAHELRKELEMVTVASPKNSFEVLEKVKKLQPEIDKLIELEYIKSVEYRLDNISERKESLKETIESYRKEPFGIPEYLIKELKEIEFAENLSGEEKKKYIIKKAHKEMTMFGSCHGIWALQKKILKEKYNIDWLTPNEEHPEIMFD